MLPPLILGAVLTATLAPQEPDPPKPGAPPSPEPAAQPSATPVSDARQPPFELHVMTFNVRYGTARDGDDRWEARRTMVLDLLRDSAADVIGLQEALDFQMREIGDALPRYRVLGQGREGGRKGEYAPLLVDRERFDVVEHGDFWLCETPERVGAKGWDAALPRMCTWALLRPRAGGPRFGVFNTHFDHVGVRARTESARLIAARVAALAEVPRIVLGDRNSGEQSPPLQALRDAGLRDSWRAVHPQATEAGTFHAFRGDRTGPKIDYVLCCARWRVVDAAIVHVAREGRYPSDHFPVTAHLQLPAPPRGADATDAARDGGGEPGGGGGDKLRRR